MINENNTVLMCNRSMRTFVSEFIVASLRMNILQNILIYSVQFHSIPFRSVQLRSVQFRSVPVSYVAFLSVQFDTRWHFMFQSRNSNCILKSPNHRITNLFNKINFERDLFLINLTVSVKTHTNANLWRFRLLFKWTSVHICPLYGQ